MYIQKPFHRKLEKSSSAGWKSKSRTKSCHRRQTTRRRRVGKAAVAVRLSASSTCTKYYFPLVDPETACYVGGAKVLEKVSYKIRAKEMSNTWNCEHGFISLAKDRTSRKHDYLMLCTWQNFHRNSSTLRLAWDLSRWYQYTTLRVNRVRLF